MDSKTQKAISLFLASLLAGLLNALLVMWAWNGVLVDVFESLKEITYFQSLVIIYVGQTVFSRYHVKATVDKE